MALAQASARGTRAAVGLHAPARDEDAHVRSVVAILASSIDTEIEGFVLAGDQRPIYGLAHERDLALVVHPPDAGSWRFGDKPDLAFGYLRTSWLQVSNSFQRSCTLFKSSSQSMSIYSSIWNRKMGQPP
jgi:hypothetical protein